MADPLVATSLRGITHLFVEAGTTGRPMTVEPAAAATFGLILELAVGRLEEIDQLTESDDRLRRELRIAEAEVAGLRQRLFLIDPARAVSEDEPRPAEARAATNIIDITEELSRERRGAGRSIGPEGGARP